MSDGEQGGWIWVSWERHRRTVELSQVFGTRLFMLESDLPRLFRHPYFIVVTIRLIRRHKPRIVFVQNPSVILTVLVCVLKRLYGYHLVVDAHNAGIEAPHAWLDPLYTFMQRCADVTVVSNEGLAVGVAQCGGSPYVLPDKVPQPPPSTISTVRFGGHQSAVLFICTFAEDEPWREVLEAASRFEGQAIFYVTGRCPDAVSRSIPRNVVLTGFLPDDEYWSMFRRVNLAIDLTRMDHCLVCGAYEAVAAGTPMILSDTPTLREYFHKGFLFVGHEPTALVDAIRTGLKMEAELRRDMIVLREELADTWPRVAEGLFHSLQVRFGKGGQ